MALPPTPVAEPALPAAGARAGAAEYEDTDQHGTQDGTHHGANPVGSTEMTRIDQQIAQVMLQTVRATCRQSGAQSIVVAKNKEWRFRDDAHFLAEVTSLLEQAAGHCSLSRVQLELHGDESLFTPSLDRIRSDGHYEPGNLQIVARFVNRWKSDMADDAFRRLLDAVRQA